MYNLAKLLTEEPEKLEKVGFIFLKLLVTLFIGSTLFGFNISISEFVQNPITQDFTISKFILFFILLAVIWLVVWTIIAEMIIAELLIWLLSKIGDKKDMFTDILHLLKIVKKDKEYLSPNKNTIRFNKIIHAYNDEDEKKISEGKSRIRQYYIVTAVIFVTLLCAKDVLLPCWLKCFGGFMIINLILGCVVFNMIHNYFTENLDEMKKLFSRMAFSQMIIDAMEQNSFIKHHYEKGNNWKRIHLKRKTDVDWLPKSLKFFPVYYWNDALTKAMLDKGLKQRAEKDIKLTEIEGHYDVLICNIKPDDENIRRITSQPGFAYLYCENEEQIFKNLEVLFFKITNGMYRVD